MCNLCIKVQICTKSSPGFQEYWLVARYQIQIEQYYKTDDDAWLYRAYENPQAIIRVPLLNMKTAIQDIYEDVIFSSSVT